MSRVLQQDEEREPLDEDNSVPESNGTNSQVVLIVAQQRQRPKELSNLFQFETLIVVEIDYIGR